MVFDSIGNLCFWLSIWSFGRKQCWKNIGKNLFIQALFNGTKTQTCLCSHNLSPCSSSLLLFCGFVGFVWVFVGQFFGCLCAFLDFCGLLQDFVKKDDVCFWLACRVRSGLAHSWDVSGIFLEFCGIVVVLASGWSKEQLLELPWLPSKWFFV